METDLVNGYIREIETLFETDKIIPLDIYKICFDFYFTTKIIFYLAGLHAGRKAKDSVIDIMSAANLDTKQKFDIEIQDLDSNNAPITLKDAEKGEKWVMDYAGITFTRNLNFPSTIMNKINDTTLKFNNTIFRCGGEPNTDNSFTKYCAALIFNSHQFSIKSDDRNTINAYNWRLPDLPIATGQNVAIYADKRKQLFSIGGESEDESEKAIYSLSFDDSSYFAQDLNEWKWTKLD